MMRRTVMAARYLWTDGHPQDCAVIMRRMDRIDDIVRELRDGGTPKTPKTPDAPAAPARRTRNVAPAPASPKRLRVLLGIGAVLGLVTLAGPLLAKFGGASTVPVPVRSTQAAPSIEAIDTATAGASVMPTPEEWLQIVTALDAHRAQAIIQRSVPSLRAADAAGGPALAADAGVIRQLMAQSLRVRAIPSRIVSVDEQYLTQSGESTRALLRVVDTMGAYDLLDAQSRVARHVSARGRTTWSVELQRSTDGEWRVVSVTEAPERSAP